MADTHGFETVAEFGEAFLRKVLRAAWKSGGTESDPNVIPEFFDIPPGTNLGGWVVADGQAQIPQAGLDVAMAPDVNGVELKLAIDIQLEIQNPPVPSARTFDLAVDARVRAPVGTIGATIGVGILLDGLPPGNVAAHLTSGDPVAPLLDEATQDLVHAMYQADGPAFPHTIDRQDQAMQYLGVTAYRADIFVELFDDPSPPGPGQPDRRILLSHPTPAQLAISIPLRLRISDIRKVLSVAPTLQQPMAVDARLVLTAPYSASPGSVSVALSAATAAGQSVTPAAGTEGDNYTANNAALAGQLGTIIAQRIAAEGQQMVQAMDDMAFTYPTVPEIEQRLREILHDKFVARGAISVWTPAEAAGQTQINDVTVKALATALALGVNAGAGADANALDDFIPSGREFAIGLSAAKVLAAIDEAIHRPEDEGGFGPNFPPHRFTNVDGHDADLTRLDVSLITDFIHLDGDVTVIDAVLGSIDVDASFEVDVGLHWEDNADGTQRMVPDVGEPDVDTGLLGWILAFLLLLLSPAGLIGGIVLIIVYFVVEATAERVGGALVRDAAGKITGLDALPKQLEHIGEVDARFENPIAIASDGLVFSG